MSDSEEEVDNTQYDIEALTDFRDEDTDGEEVQEYRVHWLGYASDDDTWEDRGKLIEDEGTREKIHEYEKYFEADIRRRMLKYKSRGRMEKYFKFKAMLKQRRTALQNNGKLEKTERRKLHAQPDKKTKNAYMDGSSNTNFKIKERMKNISSVSTKREDKFVKRSIEGQVSQKKKIEKTSMPLPSYSSSFQAPKMPSTSTIGMKRKKQKTQELTAYELGVKNFHKEKIKESASILEEF